MADSQTQPHDGVSTPPVTTPTLAVTPNPESGTETSEDQETNAPKRPRHPIAQQFITTSPPRKRFKEGHPTSNNDESTSQAASTNPSSIQKEQDTKRDKRYQAVGAIRFLHFQGLPYDKNSLFGFFEIGKESERDVLVEVSRQEWSSREEREANAKWRVKERVIAMRAERMRREEIKLQGA